MVVGAPREQIGVMLEIECEHRGTGRQGVGEQVQRVGGVAGEDDGVVGPCTDEPAHRLACVLERFAADGRCEPGAAVHAAVPGQERVDGVGDDLQRRCARGVVEMHESSVPAGHERNFEVPPDDVEQRRVPNQADLCCRGEKGHDCSVADGPGASHPSVRTS